MSSKSEQPTPFVIDADGRKLVAFDALAHPLVALHEGIGIVRFEDDDRTFVSLADAIRFAEGERGRNPELFDAALTAMRRFEAEVPA